MLCAGQGSKAELENQLFKKWGIMGLADLFSEDIIGVLDVSNELGKRCYCSNITKDHNAGEHVAQSASPTSLDQGTASDALPVTQPILVSANGGGYHQSDGVYVHTTLAAAVGITADSPQDTASVATQAASPLANTSVATEVYGSGLPRPTTPQQASPNPTPKKKSRLNQLMGEL
jgi:hypothetical protein